MNKPSKFCLVLLFLIFACDNEPDSDLITWQKNWNKWQSMEMAQYTYKFYAVCECIDEWTREVQVSVRNDSVISVLFTNDNLPPKNLKISDWHTINSLFNLSKTVIEEAAQYEIQYDNTYGNPKKIFIDWDKEMVDDEATFFITDVEN
ncbi:MAG: hypothetical protein ISR82_00845 [Candidatus Marinimicrobia bacterium]|nr:hypothetical protein [Candidatus Neomarinimicrobiota bacterium]MBL7009752.1 hypothetical protein [Candidatus Neomarinimicrobiota bacterium]MBL7029844.1 hypothetical protein [Candidatus Neomarinimicrobiota bacterium]